MYPNAATGGPSHGHRGSAQVNFVKIGPAVQRYARGQTDKQTHRQADRNTPQLPYRGGVVIKSTNADIKQQTHGRRLRL